MNISDFIEKNQIDRTLDRIEDSFKEYLESDSELAKRKFKKGLEILSTEKNLSDAQLKRFNDLKDEINKHWWFTFLIKTFFFGFLITGFVFFIIYLAK